MARKTLAQLEAELAAKDERLNKLEAQQARFASRSWSNGGLYLNVDKDPADSADTTKPDYTGQPGRIVAPRDLQAGDPLWIDVNLRVYDSETCPMNFKEEPEFVFGVRLCSPSYSATQEKKFQAHRAEKQS